MLGREFWKSTLFCPAAFSACNYQQQIVIVQDGPKKLETMSVGLSYEAICLFLQSLAQVRFVSLAAATMKLPQVQTLHFHACLCSVTCFFLHSALSDLRLTLPLYSLTFSYLLVNYAWSHEENQCNPDDRPTGTSLSGNIWQDSEIRKYNQDTYIPPLERLQSSSGAIEVMTYEHEVNA